MLSFLKDFFPKAGNNNGTVDKDTREAIIPISEEENINITFSQENNFYKIKIDDYVSITKFNKMLESNKEFNSIINAVNFMTTFWNSKKQKINKGIYYITIFEDKVYCILLDGNRVLVDEKIKKELDEETLRENITEERILKFDINSKQYEFNFFKHDQFGRSNNLGYYANYGESPIPELELSKDDAYKEIEFLIYNLDNIPGINTILDTTLLKEYILKELNPESYQKRRRKELLS